MGDQIIPTAILNSLLHHSPTISIRRRELSIEGPAEGRLVSSAKRRRRPTGSLSFAGKLAEQSSPSSLRCAAQNRRGLDCSGPFSGPFRGHLTYMKEREPPNFNRADAAPPAGQRWTILRMYDKINRLSLAQRKKVEARAAELIAEEMTLRELRKARKLTWSAWRRESRRTASLG
jgi:hypothetical protein